MRELRSSRKQALSVYHFIIFLLTSIVFLLSGCTSPQVGAASLPPSPAPHSTKPVVTPTLQPTPDIMRDRIAKARQMIRGMSLDQKLGQLIMVEYLGNNYQDSGLQAMITQQFVGGFLYQESNHNFDAPLDKENKVNAFSQQATQDAAIPLLIATDQEGGLVNRLYRFHGDLPSARQIAASGDPNMSLQEGSQAAKWMLELGINADLAPVVDVQTVDPPVLASRMFGRNPETVATYAGAFLDGLQTNGVAGCLKHFPGLGAVTSDPHSGLPTVSRNKADLEKIDFAPYKRLIQRNQPAMIMSTDVLMPAIDARLPAELSPQAINGVLRGELGYDGVVITDGLYMQGISDNWSLSEASVMAILAGNDLIEGPYSVEQVASVVTALKQAIQQGRLSTSRIDQSLQRILLMKMRFGLLV